MNGRTSSAARPATIGIGATAERVALAAGLALVVTLAGCEREHRRLEKTPIEPNPVLQADGLSKLQPGQPGPGMRQLQSLGLYNEDNAYEVAQGKLWFRWFNCVGCHAQGGGGMGPALMDNDWIYGKDADAIFKTIVDGRPNGMPAFRGRIPERQVWQLVAYVRSMSGMLSIETAPSRTEGMSGGPPENRRDAVRPDERKPK
jgi:cytochrome c oxidase cbb3-type subunit 3